MATNSDNITSPSTHNRAQDIFRNTREEYKSLIRDILKEERDVMHLKRRSDIHQRLYDHVKRIIK